MKAWTLRNLPEELVQYFRREARERHESINKTIVHLMIERFGFAKSKKTKVHHDLDHWFGKWSREEADEFDRFIMEQRRQDQQWWDK